MALKGQVALVLGSASGIGLATAKELLRAEVNVAVGDVAAAIGEEAVEQLRKEFGAHRVLFIHTDVCSDEDMETAFIITKQHFKRLDIFINSAGIFNDFNWNLEVDINFKGIIRGTLLAWKHMGKNQGNSGGVVINVASQLGLEAFPGCPIYSATKHAVIGFGRSIGMKFNVDCTAVRVVTVCPALTETPLIQRGTDLRMLTQEMADLSFKQMDTFPKQKPENVAHGILHVIQHGESSSVWVSEGGEPIYEVEFSERQDMRAVR